MTALENFRPMLAEPVKDLTKLRLPLDGTVKLDGWRCVCLPDRGPVTRALLPLPNVYVRTLMNALGPYLDGELIIEGAADFGKVQSPFASHGGAPAFSFYAFDWIEDPRAPYEERLGRLEEWALMNAPDWVKVLRPTRLETVEAVAEFYADALEDGHEGAILRDPQAPYKFNRSTLREQGMLKLKPFEDFEAEVIGFVEMMRNENEQTRDELGLAKRSHHQAGMVPAGTLGKLILRREDGLIFKCGSGLDDAMRRIVWDNQPAFLGRFAKCKTQKHGAKKSPRIPTFCGFRAREDMAV